jgi:hypothetical protein
MTTLLPPLAVNVTWNEKSPPSISIAWQADCHIPSILVSAVVAVVAAGVVELLLHPVRSKMVEHNNVPVKNFIHNPYSQLKNKKRIQL